MALSMRTARAGTGARAMSRSSVSSRRSLIVMAKGKGGEEGGKSFDKSVVGIASSNGNTNILASAVAKAGLAEALSGDGPFTVFAPTDDAFGDAARALGVSKMELMNLPNLGDILKAHVVKGTVMSSDLRDGMTATSLSGGKLTISMTGPTVNGSKIVKADVKCTNGVIHMINKVILK